MTDNFPELNNLYILKNPKPTTKLKYFRSIFFLLWIYTFVYLEATHNVQNPDSTFYSFKFVKLFHPIDSAFTFLKEYN